MHEGHRERLYDKFIEGNSSLTEVETVELLLFYCIARADVKPLAGRLIEYFGSLKGILNAPVASLMKVEGVGKKTAVFFKIMNELILNNAPLPEEEKVPNVVNMVAAFREYFSHAETEQLVIALLDKNGDIIKKIIYTDYSRSEISVNIKEIAAEVVKASPYSAVMAHNHFSGNINPSLADDLTTRRMMIMMNVHGVTLYDHLIFCNSEYYSYHVSGRLNMIREQIKETVK